METAGKRIKISSEDKVLRILDGLCTAGASVFLQLPGEGGTSVRATASTILNVGKSRALRIDRISEQGMIHLQEAPKLRVEFRGLATHMAFPARVLSKETESLVIQVPSTIYSLERRENLRYGTTELLLPSLELHEWTPNPKHLSDPSFFDKHTKIASRLPIADVSESGVKVAVRFPGPLNQLEVGQVDHSAALHLPMSKPLPVSVEVRWMKRVHQNVHNDGAVRRQRLFFMGFQFVQLDDEGKFAIRKFIQQLSLSDAI